MKKTKIDWCDCTVNPVVGCRNGCEYCYARKLNDRFHFVKDWRDPEFFPERLKQLNSKKPQAVFMDSMSDFFWWSRGQVDITYFEGIKKNPQHKYIFLTKGRSADPYQSAAREMFLWRDVDKNRLGKQIIFLGRSVTTQNMVEDTFESGKYDFLSIEPILEPITLTLNWRSPYLRLVIIGAETGNRKGKVIPQKSWIDDIVKVCDRLKIKVFMKESLRKIMGEDFRQDKLLWRE